jgi:hypothetical protein
MHTTTSGRSCPTCRPRMTSTATISSGLRGARLYVPGRSTSSKARPAHVIVPFFDSTVTPG